MLMKNSRKWPPRIVTVRTIGYRDDDRWIVHCLEMDLIGIGATPETALEELKEAIEMQITFAIQTDKPALLEHSAPIEIIRMYEEAQRIALSGFQKPQTDYVSAGLQIKPRQRSGSAFAPANA
jgi:predicted RNase H-like HicB family nuclease